MRTLDVTFLALAAGDGACVGEGEEGEEEQRGFHYIDLDRCWGAGE